MEIVKVEAEEVRRGAVVGRRGASTGLKADWWGGEGVAAGLRDDSRASTQAGVRDDSRASAQGGIQGWVGMTSPDDVDGCDLREFLSGCSY
jgi:hypothetical protein